LQLRRLLLLSFISALLSYLGIRIEALRLSEALTIVFLEYSPGVFFGALVLASRVSGDSGVWWRRVRLMIVSVLIYYVAYHIAVNPPKHSVGIVSCSSAGLLGALMIWVACRYIIPQRLSFTQIVMASLAGVVGGAFIGMINEDWLPNWLGHLGFASGFFIWQMGVAFALFSGYFLGSETANKPLQSMQRPRS